VTSLLNYIYVVFGCGSLGSFKWNFSGIMVFTNFFRHNAMQQVRYACNSSRYRTNYKRSQTVYIVAGSSRHVKKIEESPANAKGTRDSSACMKAHCEQM